MNATARTYQIPLMRSGKEPRCGNCAAYQVQSHECWSTDGLEAPMLVRFTRADECCEAWVGGLSSLNEPLAYLWSSREFRRLSAVRRLWERGRIDSEQATSLLKGNVRRGLEVATISVWAEVKRALAKATGAAS